jgi:hypothetical protein
MGVLRDRSVLTLQILAGIGLTVIAPAIKLARKSIRWGKAHKFYLKMLVALLLVLYVYPWIVGRMQAVWLRVPMVSWQIVAGMFAFGILCFGLASILYVGFRFLMSILNVELEIARALQGARTTLTAHGVATETQEGNFIASDDEKLAQMEEIRKLKDSGMIKDEDVAEFMRHAYGGSAINRDDEDI